jgi:hypothetical protein
MSDEQLWDVVIFNLHDSEIASVIGERMRRYTGYFNAEKRAETGNLRCNDHYNTAIVPTGRFKKGDKLPVEFQ